VKWVYDNQLHITKLCLKKVNLLNIINI